MFETLKKPGSFIVKSATLTGGAYVRSQIHAGQTRGEAEDGGGEESEREVSFPYLIIMPFF